VRHRTELEHQRHRLVVGGGDVCRRPHSSFRNIGALRRELRRRISARIGGVAGRLLRRAFLMIGRSARPVEVGLDWSNEGMIVKGLSRDGRY